MVHVIGDVAVVSSSSGFHSKKFVGLKGIAVMHLVASPHSYWVIRFPSNLPSNEEGLYRDDELDWDPDGR